MKIYKTLTPPSSDLSLALGYFDGVHKGHKKVISQAVSLESQGLIPAVLTFSQNPKSILFGIPERKIMTDEEKCNSFQHLGVKILYIIDFKKICDLSAEEFVRDILSKRLNVKYAICGFNYHFGKGGLSDASDLKKLCEKYKINTKIIKPLLYKRKPISSTRIREALLKKNDCDVHKMME